MRGFSYSFAAILLVSGCGSPPEPIVQPTKPAEVVPAPAPLPERALTGKFGECQIDCRFDFRELDAESPKVIQTYCRGAKPECVSFEGVLTAAGRARLKELGAQLAAAQLEEHYGCGTCFDGSDDTVVLAHADGPRPSTPTTRRTSTRRCQRSRLLSRC